jgi:putative acetyltransferase
MFIRRESSSDIADVRAVQVAAFRAPRFREPNEIDEPGEAALLDALRLAREWIPSLSIVAMVNDEIVGHVVTTRGYVDDVPVLGLGPIAVRPDTQGIGVGSALVHATVGAAEALDEPLIALLGDPVYYSRFGFVASTNIGIAAPDETWGPNFQVRTLSQYAPSIRGRFRYAAPFDHA